MTITDADLVLKSKYQSISLSISAPLLIVLVALWVAIIDNFTLWSKLTNRLSSIDGSSIGYGIALLGLMVLLLTLPLLLAGQRYLLKPLLVLLLVVSGVLAYFTQQLGVVYDIEMVRNVIETIVDRNTQEGLELLSFAMVWFLIPTTLLPVLFVVLVRIDYGTVLIDTFKRVIWAGGIVAVVAALVLVDFKYITYFSRENSDLEVYLNPFYPIKTSNKLLARSHKARTFEYTELGADAHYGVNHDQRTVGILVVGETARRSNFSLNGYERDTNPELEQHNIINFPDTTSCGTSTAYSVPCMFSFLKQDNYTPEKAKQESNVLDVLEKAGVKTVWIDSNSSCKGVCNRIENINLLSDPDVSNPLFVEGAWHDEVLLQYVDSYLDGTEGDVLLVLHTMGSHGPAYYRRYPDEYAHFKPYCQSKAPQECSEQEIVNAYDNTIVYTDHVLASLIDKLKIRRDNSFLFYASDHGESLGENGVYLHGLPRFIAPAVQSEVPMLAWFSESLKNTKGWVANVDQVTQVDKPVSHDNISATLLGLFDVKTTLYDQSMDLFNDDSMPTLLINRSSKQQTANEYDSGIDKIVIR